MRFISKAVFLEKEEILVISDLHLGYEENLGIAIPRQQYKQIIRELDNIFREIDKISKNKNLKHQGSQASLKQISSQLDNGELAKPELSFNNKKIKKIIILGDFKHNFGENREEEWREVRGVIEFLEKKAKIIIVKGNHDNYLANIAEKYNIEIRDYYIEGEYGFIHGDKKIFVSKEEKSRKEGLNKKDNNKLLNKNNLLHYGNNHLINGEQRSEDIFDNNKIKTIFLGHLHPAISIRENVKTERYKCFLAGKYKNKKIIILPSFFPMIEGQDVSKEDAEDSNLAYDFDLRNFEVFIPTKNEASESKDSEGHQKSNAEKKIFEILKFGKVGDIGRLN